MLTLFAGESGKKISSTEATRSSVGAFGYEERDAMTSSSVTWMTADSKPVARR
jgi:hypothetical protein